MKRAIITATLCVAALTGCDTDSNAKPVYGSSGHPANCRAYAQVVIDGYQSRKYTAEESMAGLERNCGMNGWLWSHRP